jgi:hypothetical protein
MLPEVVQLSTDAPNGDKTCAWRIYNTITNDYYDRGAIDFLAADSLSLYVSLSKVTVLYPFPRVTGLPDAYYDPDYDNGPYSSPRYGAIKIVMGDMTIGLDVIQHEYAHFIMHNIVVEIKTAILLNHLATHVRPTLKAGLIFFH